MPVPIKDDFKSYDKFSQIVNPRLQSYNRIITFYKIVGDKSITEAQQYIAQFDDTSKNHIKAMFQDLKTRGLAKIRRELSEDKIYAQEDGAYV